MPPVTFDDLNPVMEKAVDELARGINFLTTRPGSEREQTMAAVQRVLLVCLHLASLMARLLDQPDCTENLAFRIKQTIYSLVKMDITVCINFSVNSKMYHSPHLLNRAVNNFRLETVKLLYISLVSETV